MSSTQMRKKRSTDTPTKRRNMEILMRKKNQNKKDQNLYHLIFLNHLNNPKHLNNLMVPKFLSHIQIIPLHLLKQSKWRMTRVTTTTLNQTKRRNARTDLNISVDYYRTELNLVSRDLSHSPFASANMLLT